MFLKNFYLNVVEGKNLVKVIFWSFLSGFLGGSGWVGNGDFPYLIFVAFVPLFILEELASERKISFVSYFFGVWFAFFIWNVLTVWWISYATVIGAFLAILATSLYMSLSFVVLYFAKRYFIRNGGYIIFICMWITQEYLHNYWELAWPWLNLGNIFASQTWLVQWYEYTGRTGGSLWILLVNLFIFFLYKKFCFHLLIFLGFTLLFPPIISLVLISSDEGYSKGRSISVVAVQPNIDPYTEKFFGIPADEQIKNMLAISRLHKAVIYVFPETAYPNPIPLHNLRQTNMYQMMYNFLRDKLDAIIISGFSPYVIYDKKETPTARPIIEGGFVDFFNSALFMENDTVQVYHKSILVVGVERIPYPQIFGFLEPLALDLGGTSGSLGTQEEPTVFNSSRYPDIKIGVPICFESVFGEYVSKMIRKGATLIAVITNDGWWNNSPGYYQHLLYARLLAIETRRWIIRSANTGVSCIINPEGEIVSSLSYGKHGIVIGEVFPLSKITFFVEYGDFIGRFCSFAAILGLFLLIMRFILFSIILKK